MKLLVALVVLVTPLPAFAQEWNAASCESALESAYASFSARDAANTTGDFNSDGRADFALLLDSVWGVKRSAIGVCLSREPRPLLILNPYETGKIFTKPKGTAFMDVETETEGVYERDVISVSDGGWIGASYILRAGVFVKIIDGD